MKISLGQRSEVGRTSSIPVAARRGSERTRQFSILPLASSMHTRVALGPSILRGKPVSR